MIYQAQQAEVDRGKQHGEQDEEYRQKDACSVFLQNAGKWERRRPRLGFIMSGRGRAATGQLGSCPSANTGQRGEASTELSVDPLKDVPAVENDNCG